MRHVFYLVAVALIALGVVLLAARPAERLRHGDIIPGSTTPPIMRSIP